MSEDNTETIAKNKPEIRTRLLNNRGIGRAYHFQSLTDSKNPQAKDCLRFIENYTLQDVLAGQGTTIFGKSASSYDMSMLIARALVLKGLDLYVVEFTDLVDPDAEFLELLASKSFPSIFIMNFMPHSTVCNDPRAYHRVQSILRKFYLNENKPLYVHIPIEYNHPHKPSEVGDLVSENFLDKLISVNYSIEVN